MACYTVIFKPFNKEVKVDKNTTLLEAALKANITISNTCGGDGICGRCKMIITKGNIPENISDNLTSDEIKKGYVLACRTKITNNLVVEIPPATMAKERTGKDKDTERFEALDKYKTEKAKYKISPIVTKVYLNLEVPTLENSTADQQRICEAVQKKAGLFPTRMDLKLIRLIPDILRESNYSITATVCLSRNTAEIMNVEPGNTEGNNFIGIIDIGTTTVVAHLVDMNTCQTIDARACFNSQAVYGSEVTSRIISAEKKGVLKLQKLIINDINSLLQELAENNRINVKDINALVCSGNTVMSHFLLGLPTENIRRHPYIATSVEPPPIRADEAGVRINPHGLLYVLPGISSWVGSDITAGILATGIHESDDISILIDIGTNGEIVIGNREWLVACSASAGPAIEGANIDCGIRAETGAIEKVYVKNKQIHYKTIGSAPPKGICGSGIIDLLSVLLSEKIISRSGRFIDKSSDRIADFNGRKIFILAEKNKTHSGNPIYITEPDIENIITAKAAIFAAIRIMTRRLSLNLDDIKHFYIAGAFGNYIDISNAVSIGLIPSLAKNKFMFAGNTSIQGSKIAACHSDAFYKINEIRKNTTYYDLMGADDYIEEFQKALFLPHTDIEQFERGKTWQNT